MGYEPNHGPYPPSELLRLIAARNAFVVCLGFPWSVHALVRTGVKTREVANRRPEPNRPIGAMVLHECNYLNVGPVGDVSDVLVLGNTADHQQASPH